MEFITVNKDRCLRDSVCVETCPMRLFSTDEDGYPTAKRAAEQFCIRCGHCVSICPTGALELESLPHAGFTPLLDTLNISPQSAIQFMKSRRSIRRYASRPIPREILLNVLDVARCAPTGTNRQQIHWILFEHREKIEELIALVAEPLRNVPYFRRLAEAWDAGQDFIFRGAPHIAIATGPTEPFDPIVDGTIALSHLDLAAHAYGLGSCWAGILSAAVMLDPKVAQSLDIPEGFKYCGALMLGYPQHEYHLIPPRNPIQVTWR